MPPFLVLVYLHTQSSVKIMLRLWRKRSYERFGKWFLAFGGEKTKKMVIYQSQSVGRGEWPWPFSFLLPSCFPPSPLSSALSPGCFFSLFPPRHCFAVAFLCYITFCGSSLLFPNSFLILCVDPSLDYLLAASSLAQLRLSCSSSLSSLLTLPHSLSMVSYPHPALSPSPLFCHLDLTPLCPRPYSPPTQSVLALVGYFISSSVPFIPRHNQLKGIRSFKGPGTQKKLYCTSLLWRELLLDTWRSGPRIDIGAFYLFLVRLKVNRSSIH